MKPRSMVLQAPIVKIDSRFGSDEVGIAGGTIGVAEGLGVRVGGPAGVSVGVLTNICVGGMSGVCAGSSSDVGLAGLPPVGVGDLRVAVSVGVAEGLGVLVGLRVAVGGTFVGIGIDVRVGVRVIVGVKNVAVMMSGGTDPTGWISWMGPMLDTPHPRARITTTPARPAAMILFARNRTANI